MGFNGMLIVTWSCSGQILRPFFDILVNSRPGPTRRTQKLAPEKNGFFFRRTIKMHCTFLKKNGDEDWSIFLVNTPKNSQILCLLSGHPCSFSFVHPSFPHVQFFSRPSSTRHINRAGTLNARKRVRGGGACVSGGGGYWNILNLKYQTSVLSTGPITTGQSVT
jgi:hypothetical protein